MPALSYPQTSRVPVPRFPAEGNEAQFRSLMEQWCVQMVAAVQTLAAGPDVLNDTTRGTPDTGRVIYNTDDGNLNIGNGTNWILPNGSVT